MNVFYSKGTGNIAIFNNIICKHHEMFLYRLPSYFQNKFQVFRHDLKKETASYFSLVTSNFPYLIVTYFLLLILVPVVWLEVIVSVCMLCFSTS